MTYEKKFENQFLIVHHRAPFIFIRYIKKSELFKNLQVLLDFIFSYRMTTTKYFHIDFIFKLFGKDLMLI